jgi:hypothetical protein
VSKSAGTAAFWIDEEYDRDQASDGASRFGAYVRQSRLVAECLAECNDAAGQDRQTVQARFAAAAWETALPPVMSPGYVRRHKRVLSARVEFNAWHATLTGSVELVTPWPQPLADSRDWQRGTWWHDWPCERFGAVEYWREPGEDELAARPYLMAGARLEFPLRPAVPLPVVPSGPRGAEEAAQQAVRTLMLAMNAVVTPVIEALERS